MWYPSPSTRSGVSVSMSLQFTYIRGVIIFVLSILILYTSLVTFVIPSRTSSTQQDGPNWKGWANIDTIFSLCVLSFLPFPPPFVLQ